MRRLTYILTAGPCTVVLQRGSLARRKCRRLTKGMGGLYRGASAELVLRDFPSTTVRLKYATVRVPLRQFVRVPRRRGRGFSIHNISMRSIRSTHLTRRYKTAYLATKRIFIASYGGKLTPEKLSFLRRIYDSIGVPMCTVNKVRRRGVRDYVRSNTTNIYVVSRCVGV